MGPAIFIGDALSAAGFRLAGVETLVPEPDAIAAAFRDARARAALVLLTGAVARALPRAELEEAQLAERPTLAIVPDVLCRVAPPDLVARLRGALGIDS